MNEHAIEVLSRESAERIVLGLEIAAEREGEAHYEHLTARWCTDDGCSAIFSEVLGENSLYRTREQAIAYVAAHKRGSVWT